MLQQQNIDCSDLFERAANELKTLESKKENIIKQLAKDVEARGVPKDKVVRTVVKELVTREVASPPYIYECLGIEKKQKKSIEETIMEAENISSEQSSTVVATTGEQQQESAAEDKMSRGVNIKPKDELLEKAKKEFSRARQILEDQNSQMKKELEQKDKRIQFLEQSQKIDDIPLTD